MFPKILEIKPKEKYKLWLRYSDNTQGEVDVSHLVNKGVFKYWSDYKNFIKVKIDKETGSLYWTETVELCPDSMYLKLLGKSFEDFKIEHLVNASN